MHIPHHLPAPDLQMRLAPRKPIAEDEGIARYTRIADHTAQNRQRGSLAQHHRRSSKDRDSPRASGFDDDGEGGKPGQPFIALISSTNFCTRLAMASAEDTLQISTAGAPSNKAPEALWATIFGKT